MYNKTVFIFRRDLRICDNRGLHYILQHTNNIIPVFIFTPEQVKNNKYKSDNAVQFMIESLRYLENEIGCLNYYYGKNTDILNVITKENPDIDCICFN